MKTIANHFKKKMIVSFILILCGEILMAQGHIRVIFKNQEDSLKLDTTYIISAKKAKKEFDRFHDNYKYLVNKNEEVLDTNAREISMLAFVHRYDSVKLYPKNTILKNGEKSYVSGFQLYYGIEKKRLVPLFKWLIMIHDSSSRDPYQIVFLDPLNYYEYDSISTSFKRAPKGRVDELLTNYRKFSRINHFPSKGVRRFFYWSADEKYKSLVEKWRERNARNDSKSSIFSFQEIFLLYHQKYPHENVDRYKKSLFVYNGMSPMKGRFCLFVRNKHTIFIATDNGTRTSAGIKASVLEEDKIVFGQTTGKALILVPPVDKAANLPHLCPPSCNSISY
jgi:hypothetical protein